MNRGQAIVGYVRVSKRRGRSGERFLSPKQQEDRIRQWATSHGYVVADVLVEMDRTGRTANRPELQRAMAMIESGEVTGLVVSYMSRFGRSLIDGLQLVQRVQDAGGTFASVLDGFDLSTETGMLVFRIMMSLAEFESDRIGAGFDDARARAVRRGLHLAPHAPVGYIQPKDADGHLSGPLEVDPAAGPVVSELFRMRAAGKSWKTLREHIEGRGITTSHGSPQWVPKTLRAMLRNRVYLGEARHGEHVMPGAHPALTDEVTFRRASQPGHRPPRTVEVGPSLVQGLVRCGGCRYAMRTTAYSRKDAPGARRWSCVEHRATGPCPAPASVSSLSGLDDYVEGLLLEHLRGMDVGDETSVLSGRLDELREARAGALRSLEAYRDDPGIIDALGPSRYADGLRVRTGRLEEADREVREAENRLLAAGSGQEWVGIVEAWPGLSMEQRQRVLRATAQAVFIRRGRSRHSALSPEWVRIAWRGEEVALPRAGARPGVVAEPLPPIAFE